MTERAAIERLVRTGTVVARSDGTVHEIFPVAIPPTEGEALARTMVAERVTRSIEVGLGYGVAALYACDALRTTSGGTGRHVAMDPNQTTRFAGCGLQVLEEAGAVDLVEFHPEPSELVLPRLLADGRTFDLAFVDGNHRFDGIFVDLVYLGRLVRAGGIVFVDDHQLPSVRRAVSFCATNLGWLVEDGSTADDRHHWVVLRKPERPIERGFDHFVDF